MGYRGEGSLCTRLRSWIQGGCAPKGRDFFLSFFFFLETVDGIVDCDLPWDLVALGLLEAFDGIIVWDLPRSVMCRVQ